MNRTSLIVPAALGALAALPASAADAELQTLRDEIAQMKQAYETRIAALERRLQQAAAAPPPAAPAADRPGQVGAGTAFNPQLSLILDGVYYHDNRQGAGPEMLEHLDGINHGHADHAHGGLKRGFNLRDTELAFSATVSPYFDATALLTISEHGDVELEEAYFDTRSLPYGLKIRGGKFLSGIGYLNAQHPHQWDFVDQNLPYRTLLGDHGLLDTGLRLTWLPKTGDWYTQLGVEFLQGREQTFAADEAEIAAARADGTAFAATADGVLASTRSGPRLTTLFAKFGPDLGDRHALQFGGWVARSGQHQEVHDHSAEEPASLVHALEGKGTAWGLDAVYKYDAGGYGGQGNFKLVGEYLRLNKDLRIAFHEDGSRVGQKRDFTQDGVVLQGSYGFLPHWQAGVRYDVTGLTNRLDGPAGRLWNGNESDRWTFALTHRIDHASLLRLQASRADLWVEGAKERVNQIFLQYQHSLGAHGAHGF